MTGWIVHQKRGLHWSRFRGCSRDESWKERNPRRRNSHLHQGLQILFVWGSASPIQQFKLSFAQRKTQDFLFSVLPVIFKLNSRVIFVLIRCAVFFTEAITSTLAIELLPLFSNLVALLQMAIPYRHLQQKSRDHTVTCSSPIQRFQVCYRYCLRICQLSLLTHILEGTSGYVSYREESEGTWFIKALSLTFMRDAHECHVDRLLQIVSTKTGWL